MIVDGKKLAAELRARIKDALSRAKRDLAVSVFAGADDLVAKKFTEIKKKTGEELGITVRFIAVSKGQRAEELMEEIAIERADGILIQLPLPAGVDLERVLSVLPADKDLDRLGIAAQGAAVRSSSEVLPPVVGAMAEIARVHNVAVAGKEAVVVGKGRLVGGPAALWLEEMGARVKALDDATKAVAPFTERADIIVLGAGVPALLKPHMIKDGAVIFDAGTSEVGGRLKGDADPLCAEKASLFTPTPGGIGPLAVAMIFKNLLLLNRVAIET